MSHLTITRGLPGCGKTTYARDWVDEDRKNRIRVNRDDLRQMLDAGEFRQGITEHRVLLARNAVIQAALKRGLDVINDDTNLPSRTVRDLQRVARSAGASFYIHDMTDVDVQTCRERNKNRTDKAPVPDDAICQMHNNFIKGKPFPLPFFAPEDGGPEFKPYEDPGAKREAIIVDVDGTLALKGDRSPYDETRVGEDLPNKPVIGMIENEICRNYDTTVIVMSGRTEACRDATVEWLDKYLGKGVAFDLLYMRETGDMRKDARVKYELFDKHVRGKFRVKYVLDDRDQVVEMWRAIGLPCFQVADGNF